MNKYRFIDKFPYLDEKICNSQTGLVTNLFQWVPEPDDPKIYMIAAKMNKKDMNGHQVASDLNSAAGFTMRGAYQAAIGETIERYSSSFIHDDIVITSYHQLNEKAVNPDKFTFFADDQYGDENFPYEKFTGDTVVGWTRAMSLTNEQIERVPACCVYLPYIKDKLESNIWDCVSTGLACSASLEDAILRGIYEVVERDAISNMWLNKLSMPQVDISSNAEIYKLFKSKLEVESCNYHFVDITTDIGIPTYFGVIEQKGGGILVSASTNNDPIKALKKVMLELSQGRISWKQDIYEGIGVKEPEKLVEIRDFKSRAKLYTNQYMKKYAEFIYASASDRLVSQNSFFDNGRNLLKEIVSYFKENGLEILYVDLTPSEIRRAGY